MDPAMMARLMQDPEFMQLMQDPSVVSAMQGVCAASLLCVVHADCG